MKSAFNSKEMHLLHLSILSVNDISCQKKAEIFLRKNKINWDDLILRAGFHGIRPQLGFLVGKMPENLVPPDIVEQLTEAIQQNLYQQLSYVAEFFEIKRRLDDLGIIAVPFKGFWLASAVYGNLALRESSDIDLFIDVKDLPKIKPIMLGRGYVIQKTLTELTEEYIIDELAEYNFDKYAEDICKFHIEFHWRIGLAAYKINIALKDLESQIIKSKIQNRELPVFTPEANLLLTVMHHGAKDCFIRLKYILDIANILKTYNNLDWQWIMKMSKRFGIDKLIILGIQLAGRLSAVQVPSRILKSTNRNVNRLLLNRIRRMELPVIKWNTFTDEMQGWVFKIRSRTGINIKLYLLYYALRKILLPRMVPLKYRHHFFNKKIRLNPIAPV